MIIISKKIMNINFDEPLSFKEAIEQERKGKKMGKML